MPEPQASKAMTWRPTSKLFCYVGLMVAAVATALATGRPEAVVMAVPFALVLAGALSTTTRLGISVTNAVDATVLSEGDKLEVKTTMRSAGGVHAVEAYFAPSSAFTAATAPVRQSKGVNLVAGVQTEMTFRFEATRWGNREVGRLYLRARSAMGLLEAQGVVPVDGLVTVYPKPESLSRLVRSRRSNLAAGSLVSSVKANGMELAGVRAYASGDRARDVNWRASARYQGLYTNERHPEQATDVVLALDTFDTSMLPQAVRAACALADAYLEQRDRLGLVKFGASLRWLRPGMGLRQRYLVVNNLLSTAVVPSAVWKGVDLLPPRVLPARALVICLTSLEDERSKAALTDLRNRGVDVVAIEMPPVVKPRADIGRSGMTAYRLWQLQRLVTREQLRFMGIPTAEWAPDRPLQEILEEVNAWSRRAWRV